MLNDSSPHLIGPVSSNNVGFIDTNKTDSSSFETAKTSRKEREILVLEPEINSAINAVNKLHLSQTWPEVLLGIFSGVIVSGLFGLASLYQGDVPQWTIIATWVLTGIGVAGAILCFVFLRCLKKIEKDEKRDIEHAMKEWIAHSRAVD